MSLIIEQSLFVVRDLEPGQRIDPEGAQYSPGAGGPGVPTNWTSTYQDGGIYSLARATGERLEAVKINDNGAQGLFACFSDIATLDLIKAAVPLSASAEEAWRRKNEAGFKPYLRWFRMLTITGAQILSDGQGGTFEHPIVARPFGIVPEGVQIPDWQAVARPWYFNDAGAQVASDAVDLSLRVDTIHGFGLTGGISSLDMPALFEAEPDPGA